MSDISNEELSARLKNLNGEIEKKKGQKIELSVKHQQLSEKVEQMKPKIQEAFGTTDVDELVKKKQEFIAELNQVTL